MADDLLQRSADLLVSFSLLLAAGGPASMGDTVGNRVGATEGGTLRPEGSVDNVNRPILGNGVAVMRVPPATEGPRCPCSRATR